MRNIESFSRFVGEWWHEPVDYVMRVQYFNRAMSGAVQYLIGMGTGLNAVISAAILAPSAGTLAGRVAVAVFVVLQVFWAWMWCYRPWPSRRMSLAFVASADIAITAMVLLDATWLLGSFGLSFFSMLSVYLVFFDGPRTLASHIAWILVTTTAFAVRVGVDAEFDVVEFTAQTVLAAALAMGTPLGVQAAIWALHNDAKQSVTDPLTGLLNRRGLNLHVGGLVDAGGYQDDARLVVMVVDLDRFKSVNDTYGHAVGDEVLIRSARRITSAVRDSALVARVGGEEFVVVDILEQGNALIIAERVLSAIAAPTRRAPITASVGASSVALAEFAAPGGDLTAALETSLGHADRAMFDVKNRGGNAAIHLPATGSL